MLVATPTRFLFGRHTFSFRLSHLRRRVGCDRWRLHERLVRELSDSISVQCFIVTSSLFMFPFPFYLLFFECLYISFSMLLCLVCVCLSITLMVRNIFVLRTHGTYTSHIRWDIRPYTRVYVSHKEWSICGHAGSPTCLITVKPHLDFSSFGDALSLIVLIATMYYLRGWYL